MPIYEYCCTEEDCGHITELEQSITEEIPKVVVCEKCDGVARKIVSRCTFKLVGEGWPGQDGRKGID